MSSLPASSSQEPTHAYPAPWRLDRTLPPPWFRLGHRGFEPAEAVTVTLLGSARLIAAVPGAVLPGASIRFAIRGSDVALDSTLIVRWVRPNGEAYLWRAAF